MGLISVSGTDVRMLHHQKAHQGGSDHTCNSNTSMSLVVLSQTVPMSIPLPMMIQKTGFQICHGKLKHDQPTHYSK